MLSNCNMVQYPFQSFQSCRPQAPLPLVHLTSGGDQERRYKHVSMYMSQKGKNNTKKDSLSPITYEKPLSRIW
jgi:hypothetical protein